MKQPLKYTCPKFNSTQRVTFKNCFGATAGYISDRIFMSCGKFGVALKLPNEELKILFKKKDVKQLKYFPKGHIKKQYAVLPGRILRNKMQFQKLVNTSLKYVSKI